MTADRNRGESIRHRLRNVLRGRGEDAQFGLQRYSAERFLYRLGESPHRERFVLKGAALYALWGGALYRATRDLDFTGFGSPVVDDVLAAMAEVCTLPGADHGLTFDPQTLTAEPIRDDSEYAGLRVRLEARLGESRIPVQLDVGFGNAILPAPSLVSYPTLLDDPAPRILAYPLESVIAEKLHAMVLLGERNSRFKDFYDLYVIAGQFDFEGKTLARAVAATFERRRTAAGGALPAALTPGFFADEVRAAQWRAYLGRNQLPRAPADFAAAGEVVVAFLAPVWEALERPGSASPQWPRGGGWETRDAAVPSTPAGSGPEPIDAKARGFGAELRPTRPFRPYPAYKDSGVEWLGEIPAHWSVKRLKHLVRLNPEALPEETEPGFEMTYVDIGGVDTLGRIVERERLSFAAAPSRARRLVRDGDVIVSTVRTYLRAIAPIRAPEPGMVVSTGFAVVRPDDDLTTDFAAYALRAPYFVERVVANSKGVSFPAINESEMATYELAAPPIPEQRAIAAFLDRETARIDALVAKKERLIELLEERRTALITRAVTKGLDPNVPMKDSGVEGLGDIPAHWQVTRLRYACSLLRDGTHQPPPRVGDGYPLLSVRNIVDRKFIRLPDDSMISEPDFRALQRTFALQENDVVLAIVGATLGKVATVGPMEPFAIQRSLAVLRARPKVLQYEYLALYLEGQPFQDGLWHNTGYSAQPGIYLGTLASFPLLSPPIEDQAQIVAYLRTAVARVDALILNVRDAIQRLKELRTGLISAAVTGKIDVREAAA
jgi:type I restriction enzyme S subunit